MTCRSAVRPVAISTVLAVVLADGDGLEVDVAVADDADLQALGAEEQRVGGDGELAAFCGILKCTKT